MDKSRIITQNIRIELQLDPIRISNRMRLQPRITIHLLLRSNNRHGIRSRRPTRQCRRIVEGVIVIIKAGEVGGRIEGGEVELIGDADDICSSGVFWFGVWIWCHDDDDGCY